MKYAILFAILLPIEAFAIKACLPTTKPATTFFGGSKEKCEKFYQEPCACIDSYNGNYHEMSGGKIVENPSKRALYEAAKIQSDIDRAAGRQARKRLREMDCSGLSGFQQDLCLSYK